MKACGGRGDGARPGRVDGLIARPVRGTGRPVPADIRRQRGQPMGLEKGRHLPRPIQPDARPAHLLPRRDGRPGRAIGEGDHRPDRTPAGRPEERRPVLRRRADRMEQQDLDVLPRSRRCCPSSRAGRTRVSFTTRQSPARRKRRPRSATRASRDAPDCRSRTRRRARVAVLRRLLGDPILRQRVVVQGELARGLDDASQCGFLARRPGRDGAGRPCGRPRRRRARAPRTRTARSASAGS